MSTQNLILSHIDHYVSSNPNATFADYLASNLDFIVDNSVITGDYKGFWHQKFKAACISKGIAMTTGRPDWGPVAVKLLEAFQQAQSCSPPSPSSPSTSRTPTTASASNTTAQSEQKKLSAADQQRVFDAYASMEEADMWRLSSGKLVEVQMRKLAEVALFEHPVHSIILDPSDPKWIEYFTESELQEIRSFRSPAIPPLPTDVDDFLGSFHDLTDLDDLFDRATSQKYHPVRDATLFWMQQSIIQALNLLFNNYLKKQRTESDLIKRVWSFLDTVLDSSELVANSGEKASKATSEAANKDRAIGAADPTERKKIGTKVDVLYSAQLFEFGAVEAGACSDRSGTKSVLELGLKCPKTLKDMLVEMERANPESLRSLRCCGFVLSGLYLQYVVADCPAGHVCRVTKLPDWEAFPDCAGSFAVRFTYLLHLVWASRQVMEETKHTVTTLRTRRTPTFTPSPPKLLCPSFTHATTKAIPKKRKATSQSSSTTSSKKSSMPAPSSSSSAT